MTIPRATHIDYNTNYVDVAYRIRHEVGFTFGLKQNCFNTFIRLVCFNIPLFFSCVWFQLITINYEWIID